MKSKKDFATFNPQGKQTGIDMSSYQEYLKAYYLPTALVAILGNEDITRNCRELCKKQHPNATDDQLAKAFDDMIYNDVALYALDLVELALKK